MNLVIIRAEFVTRQPQIQLATLYIDQGAEAIFLFQFAIYIMKNIKMRLNHQWILEMKHYYIFL